MSDHAVAHRGRSQLRRRVPQQVRSRHRFERILEVAAQLVVERGVDSVNTRVIAAAAGIPVASLYQYFADKEEILLALVERDLAEMSGQVAEDVAALDVLSVRGLVETTIRGYVQVYLRRPAFVVVWLRGRTNPVINDFCRAHNRRVASELFEMACRTGMVLDPSNGRYAELATEVSDRLLQVAFEHRLDGDPLVIAESITVVTNYLETHATPEGIAGVPNDRSVTRSGTRS